jgi:hypothetical protein
MFRITQVQHTFSAKGATTQLSLHSDCQNSIPRGTEDFYSVIIRATSPDFQDRTFASLKVGGDFDIGLTILAKDYPSS